MPRRFQDEGRRIYEFGDGFLVRCPRCSRRAEVVRVAPPASDAFRFEALFDPRRCVCGACGFVREWRGGSLGIGGPCDWYLGLPLWLQTPCCRHVLWAYNAPHLRFLEDFVGAELRERTPNPLVRHTSLASRLPRWMQSGQHRAEIMDGLARLRARLEA